MSLKGLDEISLYLKSGVGPASGWRRKFEGKADRDPSRVRIGPIGAGHEIHAVGDGAATLGHDSNATWQLGDMIQVPEEASPQLEAAK